MRALPSLHTNMLLNSHVLQRELDMANASRDRQIYPVIGPGPEPDTSELTLKVKDQLPLHARLELNNQATPGTPDLRANFSAQYDNLWDLEHQIGLQYSFSPEQFKNSDPYNVTPSRRSVDCQLQRLLSPAAGRLQFGAGTGGRQSRQLRLQRGDPPIQSASGHRPAGTDVFTPAVRSPTPACNTGRNSS